MNFYNSKVIFLIDGLHPTSPMTRRLLQPLLASVEEPWNYRENLGDKSKDKRSLNHYARTGNEGRNVFPTPDMCVG